MQTILGTGSAISTDLARELNKYTSEIRLVSRNPKAVNKSDELKTADLLNPVSCDEAIKGSEVVYVTIGFEYKLSVWKEVWLKFTKNLIASSHKYDTKIVFLDNMYMYDAKCLSNMTEESPINPPSEKGKIRAEVFSTLMNASTKGEVAVSVGRAADFYGPGVTNSLLNQTVYNNLLKNKSPQLLGQPDSLHNFTYSRDIAKALALLGNTPESFNQVWHLPSSDGKLTLKQWVELFMGEMGIQKKDTDTSCMGTEYFRVVYTGFK